MSEWGNADYEEFHVLMDVSKAPPGMMTAWKPDVHGWVPAADRLVAKGFLQNPYAGAYYVITAAGGGYLEKLKRE